MRQPRNANPATIHRLSGDVELSDIRAVRAAVLSRAKCPAGLSHVIDCTTVTGTSAAAIAALAQLIRDVRRTGSRLTLVNLDRQVQATILERLVEAFLMPTLQKHATPVPAWSADRLRPSTN